MASSLKWATGFSWGAVFVLVAAGYGVLRDTGAWHNEFLVITAVTLLYMLVQFYNWNGPGWRKFHYRASALPDFLRYLNQDRFHMGINGLTPMQRLARHQ